MVIQRCTTDASACSLSCLSSQYEGGMLIREALDGSAGLTPSDCNLGFHRPRNGRMLQADGISFRGSD